MKVIIIGGSMAGLSAGIALNCKGFETAIYERANHAMESRGAGLVIQNEMIDYMLRHQITTNELFGVPANETQQLDSTGRAVAKYQNNSSFTSWNHIWKQLKASYPAGQYHFSHELENIEQRNDKVYATFTNGKVEEADLLVGADGYHSVVRKYMLPGIEPSYAGYIAYRGLLPEALMSAEEVSFFENKISFYQYPHSRILAFMVPGQNEGLLKGERLFNWVWSANKTMAELHALMMDKNGRQRDYSMPASYMNEQSLLDLYERADTQLPEIFSNIVRKTKEPFVQAMVDLKVDKMFTGRVAILGDAAFVVRPHTASGTSKASKDGIVLAERLFDHQNDIGTALQHWETDRKKAALKLYNYGRELAVKSGFGFEP